MSVYTAVKEIAESRGVSIYRIERDLNFSNGSLSHWDKGVPKADRLQNVADYLGVTIAFILNKSKDIK